MTDEVSEGIVLRCLRGGMAPAGLSGDLRGLLDLPEAARDEFWVVLGAYLRPRLDDEAQRTIVGYCSKHELSSEQLAPAVKAARFLFQESARADLGMDGFAADVATTSGEDDAPELIKLLSPWYEDFRPRLRGELVRRTVADHGKLVTETRWRVDTVAGSDRGVGLDTSVAIVTFNYREGDRVRRITLQLLPEQIDELRQAADEMLA